MMCAYLLRPKEADGEPLRPQRRSAWRRTTAGFDRHVLQRIARGSDRVIDAATRGYARSLNWALAVGPLMIVIMFATIGLNVYLYTIVPKGFFPQQDTGLMGGAVVADQAISFQAMRVKLQRFADIVTADPAVDQRRRLHRRRPAQLRQHVRRAEAAVGTQGVDRRGDRAAARQDRARAGRHALLPGRAGRARRRTGRQRAVPVHAAGRRPERAADLGAEDPPGPDHVARARGRQHRHAGQGAADVARDRPRRGVAARRERDRHRHHAQRPLRAAPGLDDLQRAQPVQGGDGGRAAVLAEPRPAARRVREREGRLGPARELLALRDDQHGAARQSPGPVRRVDDLVQPARGRDAVASDGRDRERDGAHRRAGQHPRRFPGHRQGLSRIRSATRRC